MEEKVFGEKYQFQYIFKPCKESKYLLVCLSSCININSEDKHPYHMMNITKELPCNKLYIRDSLGNRGTYYLCYNMDFEVIDTVTDLIKNVCVEYSISMKNVITLGSSKGGSAALLVGLKLKCGNIICSVPQIQLGTYISNYEDVRNDMIGDQDINSSIEILDNYIFDCLDEPIPRIHILTSENDTNYKENMVDFIEILKKSDRNHYIEINNKIIGHQETSNYNVEFFMLRLLQIMYGIEISINDDSINFSTIKSEFNIVIRDFKDEEKKLKCNIHERLSVNINDISIARVDIVEKDQLMFSWIVYKWLSNLITSEYIEFENKLIVNLKSTVRNLNDFGLKYCVYLQKSDGSIIKTEYQDSNVFIFDYDANYKYNCTFYVFYDNIRKSYTNYSINLIKRDLNIEEKFELCKYEIEIVDTVLRMTLLPLIPFAKNSLFCYYLLKDGKAVYKGKYSNKKSFEIDLSKYGAGIYSVIYYVLENNERIFKRSTEIVYIYKCDVNPKIDIYGSCVSRDVMEFINNESIGFSLGKYIARQSIFSAVSMPYEIGMDKIHLDSEFQKRMVYSDMHKTAFTDLKNSNGDYIIIDLIDERFSLCRINNQFYTMSNEFKKSFPFPLKNSTSVLPQIKNNEIYIDNLCCTNMIVKFCDKIKRIYGSNRIIIHYALMVDQYINTDGEIKRFEPHYLKNNKKTNELLCYMYEMIIKNIPEAKVIKMPEETYADENNKWELAPMHYCEGYYKYVCDQLYRIIINDRNNG